MAAEDHAILIGIERYPGIKDLRGAVNDARAVFEWLRDPDGGDVPKSQIHQIDSAQFEVKNPRAVEDERPMTSDVYAAFEKLISQGEKKQPGRLGRRLYIFMAGHGFAPGAREAALLMANAQPSNYGHNVCGGAVAEHLVDCSHFDEVVLLMDCCRSKLDVERVGIPPWERIKDGRAPSSRWVFGFATAYGSGAVEKEIDGEVRGIFTTAVLEALSSGPLSSRKLDILVSTRMGELMGPDDFRRPHFQPGPEEFELGSKKLVPTLCIHLAPGTDGEPVQVAYGLGGGEARETKILKGEEVWEVEVDHGIWEVFRVESRKKDSDRVTVPMGKINVPI